MADRVASTNRIPWSLGTRTLRRVALFLALAAPLLLLASFCDHLLVGCIMQGCRLDGLAPEACVRAQAVAARANMIGLVGLLCGATAVTIAVTAWPRRRAVASETS
jgi:hypothetical protein